ncbi:MAG TPA: Nif3-like dinuclear metal center hexameric protein, partial [Ruminococcaceae bacterium]|nr:Nif3-like dinuclear metal center hexameric protein [Oscillospiraceae bacterium]
MTTVQDIYDFLNSIAPFDTQESWDNSGFSVGSSSQEVTVAALALDITPQTVRMAQQAGAQLLISHHPVIFHPVKSVKKNDPVFELVASSISAVCAHTNLDAAQGGVNDVLAQLLGLENIRVLPIESSERLLRCGTLPEEMTAEAFGEQVQKVLGSPTAVADGGKPIRTVAVCGGAGGDFIGEVAGLADAYVTGEIAHHEFLQASQRGLTAVAAGHFETENPVVA